MRQAQDSGWRVVAVDGDPSAVGFEVADVAEATDFNDVEQVVEVGRRHAIDAVVAISSDRAVPIAAAVAERLPPPPPAPPARSPRAGARGPPLEGAGGAAAGIGVRGRPGGCARRAREGRAAALHAPAG